VAAQDDVGSFIQCKEKKGEKKRGKTKEEQKNS
jgi:hypothetical protein